jgi:membrane-bound ClpP family serine protease
MKSVADKLGMFLSGLCAIQCAMLPILLSVSAVVPNWAHFGHGWVWLTVIGAIALWSFSRGWQKHRSKRVISLFLLGFSFLIAGTLMEDRVHIIVESSMFVIGGVLMVLAHWRNYQLMKCIKPVVSEGV